MRLVAAVLCMLLISGCEDSHRHFSGPEVAPLWSVDNLNAHLLFIRDGVLYVRGFQSDPNVASVVHLYAFDVRNGKPLWNSEFVPDYPDSIEISAGVVYVVGYALDPDRKKERHVYALDAKSGRQLWATKMLVERILYVLGSTICVTESNTVHTLDVKTGEEMARPFPTNVRRAAVVEGVAYRMATDGTVIAQDSPTHTLWTAHLSNAEFLGPVVAGDTVYYYCPSAEDSRGCQTPGGIYAFDRQTGTLRWSWKPDHFRLDAMEADATTVYVSAWEDHGVALALDAATGNRKWTHDLLWKSRDYYVRTVYRRPLLLDSETVVFFDQPTNKQLPTDPDQLDSKAMGTAVRAYKRTTGEPLWESKLPWKYDRYEAQDGLLFAIDGGPHSLTAVNFHHDPDSWFTVLDLRSGKQLWRSDVWPLSTLSPPLLGEGTVVVARWPYGDSQKSSAEIFAFRAVREPYTK